MGAQRRSAPPNRWGFWTIVAVASVATIYSFFRILWSQTHPIPSIDFTDDLRVESRSAFRNPGWAALRAGDELKAINDVPVNSIDDARRQMRASARQPLLMVFERKTADGVAVRKHVFQEVQAVPELELSDDMELLAVDGVDSTALLRTLEGSRVRAIGGQEYGSLGSVAKDVTTPDEFDSAIQRELGLTVWLDLESEDGITTTWIMRVRDWRISWTVYIVGTLFIALGLWVYRLQPEARSSRGFLFFCCMLGVFWLVRGIPHVYRFPLEKQFYLATQLSIPLATLIFAFTFTAMRSLKVRLPIVVMVGLLLAVVMYISNWLVFGPSASEAVLGIPLLATWALLLLFVLVMSLLAVTICRIFRVRLGSQDIQRARALRVAAFTGFFGSTVFTFFRSFDDQWYGIAYLAEFSVLLFPAIIGYAIVRYNFLQLSDLVRDGVLFAVFASGVILFNVLLAVFIAPMFQQLFPGTGDWFERAVTIAIVLGGIPIHARVRERIGQRYRQRPVALEAVLDSLDDVSAGGESSESYAGRLARDLSRVLQAEPVHILILNSDRSAWRQVTTAPQSVEPPSFQSCNDLVATICQLRSPVLREDVIEGIVARDKRDGLLGQLDRMDAAIAVPLLNKGVVIGLVAIGEKRSRTNFTRAELALIRRICRQASEQFSIMFQADFSYLFGIAASYPDFPPRIGAYEIDGALGRGGMASVFRGHQNNTQVAIKVASPDVQMDSKLMARFQREGDAMARVQHESVVAILETGIEIGEPYIVLEYLSGGTLAEYLEERHRLDEREALRIARQIASGLNAAHKVGIAHRDLKPQNVLFDANRNAKVGDFGIARVIGDPTMTTTGTLMGTPHYMSPEMLLGNSVDWRADQFALGIMLFEMVTGTRPFTGSTIEAMTYQIVHNRLPSLHDYGAQISPKTEAVLKRTTQKSPEKRYPNYLAIIEAIDEAIEEVVQESKVNLDHSKRRET